MNRKSPSSRPSSRPKASQHAHHSVRQRDGSDSQGYIHTDSTIQRLLEKMPDDIASSFTDEQLMHIRNAIGARNWGNHALDWRGTVGLPLSRWRWYYVLLIGKNRRHHNRGDTVSRGFTRLVAVVFLSLSMMLGMVILYLLKSFIGLDLVDGFHLGLWDWLNSSRN